MKVNRYDPVSLSGFSPFNKEFRDLSQNSTLQTRQAARQDTGAVGDTLPVHVGIIMDGNGRWAQGRGLPRTAGHEEGLQTVKKIVGEAAVLGIRYLTLYTFSTENWKRTEAEVGFLMNLVTTHLRREFVFYREHGIRIRHIGDLAELPPVVRDEITRAAAETAGFTGLTVVLAINYGARDEIQRASKKAGGADISAFLDLPDLPDVDLLVRTGGEKRLSNFLLWQAAYAELLFRDTLWPDYTAECFREDLTEFAGRERKFGGVK
ncbi:MAG: di-trans,poly-cis-decaprenylcistransferase [Spirochaetaceae bacterium]|nr:di-trans,poly-cis-decaprenylcistransferase [Spirochaetaceae bacterium]